MEVCVESVQSAINAENGGASRIELCANLLEGGTTPSIGMLQVIKELVSIPVFVMIRPRGGDFCYSPPEIQVMLADIRALKAAGADGFVFGILTVDGEVDTVKCKVLLDAVRPHPATFHRAIDMCCDINQALTRVMDLGFERVLSSGGCAAAYEGREVLHTMVLQSQGSKTKVMPGAGITVDNLQEILALSGAGEFHGTARESMESCMKFTKPGLSMGSTTIQITSTKIVQQLLSIFNSIVNKRN
ncbi:copper homeostasis protein cutC homolog [Physella acuta]|uniref:copper homeostasis protein cutC homolog n=1 Tax=Physella acuta TaxID=109671 RepID=UPI0027DE5088|nr:copper homeostasis protein cutC homolog [Physella acuta]XP_059176703.1 copper homeostasis protein cutC homolog [Physella acuta]XP_059176711.1 copper homeostasis protein cutC homolog [Physella acuta]XP_059176721.1 copper homeostasis protein cutC homolog [Physella acuta]